MSKTLRLLPALAGVALAFSACSPKSAADLGHKLVIHGVVTDAALLTVLPGVKVTLLSADNDKSLVTDARGYFQFDNVQQIQNLLIQFQLDGYLVVTMPVNGTKVATVGTADAGVSSFPGFGADVDAFDASIALSQSVLIPVAGTVYDGSQPAKGAVVLLTTPDGTVGYQAKTGDDGRFAFTGVRPAVWDLYVLPYDRDADGFSDTQFYFKAYDIEGASAVNVGNVVIVLQDVSKAVVASSFTSLSKPYQITIADLVAGVSGVLQFNAGPLFLHFGAEVDPALTSFELVAIEPGPRYSPPIALTVAWDHASVVRLTPATPLVPSDDTNIGYELRVRELRWRDGTVGIAPAPTGYGTIDFAVHALPGVLANPTPAIYFANKFTSTQATTQAVVDNATVWLLDANGDFVYDTDPAGNFSAASGGLQLSWPHITGAARYHVMARNTTSAGNGTVAQLEWRELTAVGAPDPNQNPTVVATANPFAASAGLGTSGAPWAFGNNVQIAVVSEDALGFRAPIDTSKLLTTSDTFAGLITGVEVDNGGWGFPFGATTERGVTFNKAIRVAFSEPMNTTSVPTLTSQSANLTIKKVLANGWGSAAAPSAIPLNTSSNAYFAVNFNVKGACTEVLVGRVAGDSLLPVRDASIFAAGVGNKIAFIDSFSGAFLAETQGISAVDAPTNRVTLGTPFVVGVSVPFGALACALQGSVAEASLVPPATATSTTLGVSDASMFFVNEAVLVYEPQGATSSTPAIAEVRFVTGVDTIVKTITVPSPLSAGHTTLSLVIPLNGGSGEVALRRSATLNLVKDTAGGTDAEIFVGSTNGNLLVGDTLLIDADGDLKTTTDQFQVKVKQLKLIPNATTGSLSLLVDLPATITLLHGKSKVIGLGDSFSVGGTRDTSSTAAKALDPHRDQFTPDGFLY